MKSKFILLIVLSALFLSGCSITDSPEELTAPPRLKGDKEGIRLALKEYLPQNTKLIIPPTDDKGSAIKMVDLDGDGKEEAVVFYSIDFEENPQRALILKKENSKWVNKAEIKIIGQELDRVLFKDLNGNKGKDIIIGSKIKYSLDKNINAYTMHNGEIDILFKNVYDEVIIDDLDNDKVAEILILKLNNDSGESSGELFKYSVEGMNLIDEIYFNEKAEINYAVYDYIYKNEKGMLISTTVDKNLINTYILKVKDGKLVNLIKDGLIQAQKEENIDVLAPIDIDKDGTLEFALPNSLQENNRENLTNWVTPWYSYDGSDNIKLKAINYYDEDLNFTFQLPLKWKNKLIITNLTRHENTIKEEDYVKVEYKKDINSEKIQLFTVYIYSKDKLKRQEEKEIKKYPKILEDTDRIYYLNKDKLLDEEEYKYINADVLSIQNSFKLLED